MEPDTFILEFNESSGDGGEKVDIYCQDLAFPAHPENEKHFEDSSSFPVLLIDSVCSLSEAHDKSFESAELAKHEETLEEQLTSDESHFSYLLPSQCEEDNSILCEPEAENATDGTQNVSMKQHVQPRFSFNMLPTAATSFTKAISQNSTSSYQHSTNVVHDKLNVKYDNYRKKNNRATRQWRQKAKERQAEALEKNKRLHAQHENLVNVIRKLRSSASSSFSDADECELNSKEEKDPLADGNPTNKKIRDQRKQVKLDEENDRLTRENNRLCQVIEDQMKKIKSAKKPAGTSSVTVL